MSQTRREIIAELEAAASENAELREAAGEETADAIRALTAERDAARRERDDAQRQLKAEQSEHAATKATVTAAHPPKTSAAKGGLTHLDLVRLTQQGNAKRDALADAEADASEVAHGLVPASQKVGTPAPAAPKTRAEALALYDNIEGFELRRAFRQTHKKLLGL
jgi:hypothetical protein